MWDTIGSIVNQQGYTCICVVGDFNAMRTPTERVGSGDHVDIRDMKALDDFIVRHQLVDLPLVETSFTYYRLDGICKSRVDRALVNDEWLNK